MISPILFSHLLTDQNPDISVKVCRISNISWSSWWPYLFWHTQTSRWESCSCAETLNHFCVHDDPPIKWQNDVTQSNAERKVEVKHVMKTERQEAVVREVMLIYMWLSRMFCSPSEPSHQTHLRLFVNRLPSCLAPAYNKSLSVCRKQKTLLKSYAHGDQGRSHQCAHARF